MNLLDVANKNPPSSTSAQIPYNGGEATKQVLDLQQAMHSPFLPRLYRPSLPFSLPRISPGLRRGLLWNFSGM